MRRRFLPAVFAMAVVAWACSSKENRPAAITDIGSSGGTIGGGQSSGGSSGVNDAGDAVDDGGICLPGTYTIDADFTSTYNGTLAISGTVELADPVQIGHAIVITVASTTGGQIPSATFQATVLTPQIVYRVHGLKADTYSIEVQTDVQGSPNVGDVGDLAGFYDGVVSAPIQDPTQARPVAITQCTPAINFGIGLIP